VRTVKPPGDALFTLFVCAVAGLFALGTMPLSPAARLAPVAVLAPTLALLAVQLARDLARRPRTGEPAPRREAGTADEPPADRARRRTVVAALVGLLLLVAAVGLLLALPLFLWLYWVLVARLPVARAALIAGLAGGVLHLGLEEVLHLPLPPGLLLVGLPW
jgi:hypothetical protein